ncbi:MAG TPA: methylmalonyl Co-A mutase-associated GTPase MeaB [Sneathiellales bacterium]|nr:methylmalonyl Co-A mutase-associated GTPase MeaB [Sneathiellales bacterium]
MANKRKPTASDVSGIDVSEIARKLMAGDRRALARAITLVESTRDDHRADTQLLLDAILPAIGKSTRIGVSGPPGVGKSTFTEAFGTFLTGRGKKVAVLAVDPSSKRSGGSILGDKTRMELLARDPSAFIRPSPAGVTLGGVARRTREAMLLTEAAGFDVVLIETVGVGQSETAVADMVDLFLLLLSPGGGDELHGIKRGITELADLVVVNKADGDLKSAAEQAAAEYTSALHLMRPRSENWTPRVMLASSLKKQGMEDIWQAIESYMAALGGTGEIATCRSSQAKAWMWSEISDNLMAAFQANNLVAGKLPALEKSVDTGKTTPTAAARELLRLFEEKR